MKKALTIGGFDGSGGAGIQADLKTFSALGCYGATVLTALPVQNTRGVRSIHEITSSCVAEQVKAILEDIEMDAIKIGMLHRLEIVEVVARSLSGISNVVLDPVMCAKSGDLLLRSDAIGAIKELLFPITCVLTPNIPEACVLLGRAIATKSEMEKAALDLLEMGPQAVVVKGGHLEGDSSDCLALRGEIYWFSTPRIPTKNTHGTGCTFSAAIGAYLARGLTILEAVRQAKFYLTKAIESGSHLKIGQGNGPVNHLWGFCD